MIADSRNRISEFLDHIDIPCHDHFPHPVEIALVFRHVVSDHRAASIGVACGFANLPLHLRVIPRTLTAGTASPRATIPLQSENNSSFALMEVTKESINTPARTGLVHRVEKHIDRRLGAANRMVYAASRLDRSSAGISSVIRRRADLQMAFNVLDTFLNCHHFKPPPRILCPSKARRRPLMSSAQHTKPYRRLYGNADRVS